jgi:hypothetical protein
MTTAQRGGGTGGTMAAGASDRTARAAGALGGALVLAALGVVLSSGSRPGIAALMAVLGLAAGFAVVSAGLVPARKRRRSVVERLNDGAFSVVLSAVSLLLGITARPWTAVVPGLVGGILAGLFLRPAPDGGAGPGPGPGSSGPGPSSGSDSAAR